MTRVMCSPWKKTFTMAPLAPLIVISPYCYKLFPSNNAPKTKVTYEWPYKLSFNAHPHNSFDIMSFKINHFQMLFGCRRVMDFGDFPITTKHVFMLAFVSQQTIDKLG
jgi:hypothetical protein